MEVVEADRELFVNTIFKELTSVARKHLEAIQQIWDSGRVAVVIVNPAPEAEKHLRRLGWPKRVVLSLPEAMRRDLTDETSITSDPATRRWIECPRDGIGRVLLFHGYSSLLFNFGEEGWWIEPGSTDGPIN